MRAGERAWSVKQHIWVQNLILEFMFRRGGHGSTDLESYFGGNKDRQIPRIHCQVSLEYLRTFTKRSSVKVVLWLLHTCANTYMHTRIYRAWVAIFQHSVFSNGVSVSEKSLPDGFTLFICLLSVLFAKQNVSFPCICQSRTNDQEYNGTQILRFQESREGSDKKRTDFWIYP